MKYKDIKVRLFEHFSIDNAALLISNNIHNEKHNDMYTYDLSGKVNSFLMFTYSPEDHYGNIEIGEIKRRYDYKEVTFTRKGNIVKEISHYRDINLTGKGFHKYRGKSNKKE